MLGILSPLVAFFLLSNISTIPKRLYDLADIDKMSNFEKFWNVTFPPLRFTIFVFTCITIVMSLKLHDFIFTLSQGGPGRVSSTLTYEIYKLSFKNMQLRFWFGDVFLSFIFDCWKYTNVILVMGASS